MRHKFYLALISFTVVILSAQNCTQARLALPEEDEIEIPSTTPSTTLPTIPSTTLPPPPPGPPPGQIPNGGTEEDNSDPKPGGEIYGACEYRQPGTPAVVQPEYIDVLGTQHRLWPESGLRPADPPNSIIPRTRDSSEYTTREQPCEHWTNPSKSLNRFVDMSQEGNYLYIATSSGFSVWDIAGGNAQKPQRGLIRDGLCDRGSWLWFPPQGENDFFTKNISTFDKGNGETVILVSGLQIFSIWTHNRNTNQLIQNYQLRGGGSSDEPTKIVTKGDAKYTFQHAATGIYAFNLSLLSNLTGCLETYDFRSDTFSGGCNPFSPELIPYAFDGSQGFAYRINDIIEVGGKIVLITKGGAGTNQRVEISFLNKNNSWAQFESRVILTSSQHGVNRLTGAFVKDGKLILPVARGSGHGDFSMVLLDVTDCVLNGNNCSTNREVFSYRFAQGRDFSYVDYSKDSRGREYIYLGKGFGLFTDRLLDITGVLNAEPIVLDMTVGSSFVDPCTGYQLNYFEAMSYPATYGTNNRKSYFGKWFGDYFYRGAVGVFEVHELAPMSPP